MKDKTIRYILVGLIYLLAAFSFIFGAITIANSDGTIKETKVKCYDAFHNEIVGETCIDKEYSDREGVGICLAGIFLIILAQFVNSMLKDSFEEEEYRQW